MIGICFFPPARLRILMRFWEVIVRFAAFLAVEFAFDQLLS